MNQPINQPSNKRPWGHPVPARPSLSLGRYSNKKREGLWYCMYICTPALPATQFTRRRQSIHQIKYPVSAPSQIHPSLPTARPSQTDP